MRLFAVQGLLFASGFVLSGSARGVETTGPVRPAASAERGTQFASPGTKRGGLLSSAKQRREAMDESSAVRRRRELDDMRREDVASQLALLGVPLKWQEHSLTELTDWRDRIEAAVTLRVQHRIDINWRVTSLPDLVDIRLRAAKASELASQHGIQVDWRRHSWTALETLRRQMNRNRRPNSIDPSADDALMTPGSVGRARRPGVRPRDPDAIIEPTFALETPLLWARPSFGGGFKADPDAILIPTFVTVPSPPAGPDDVIDPWNARRASPPGGAGY